MTGRHFSAATRVTFGGVPATGVTVTDATTLMATTPSHAAGAVDVGAGDGSGGATSTLRSAFQFIVPSLTNTPPIVTSLTAASSRGNAPLSYANVGETLTMSAIVSDAETPVSALAFEWTADAGTIAGNGTTVTWHAPATARTASVRLTVTESYSAPDANGLPQTRTHVVSANVSINVHDEASEIGGMARTFLERFSQSAISPDAAMVDFKDGCGVGGHGRRDEYDQVTANRRNWRIIEWSVGAPSVSVAFKGASPFRTRSADAWARVDVRWVSVCLTSESDCGGVSEGAVSAVSGVDWVTSEYDAATKRWWLCDSDFDPAPGTPAALRRVWK
ncbi:MAG: IPT/TIG domain-containing protein [Vicinamibacterales bacterium]